MPRGYGHGTKETGLEEVDMLPIRVTGDPIAAAVVVAGSRIGREPMNMPGP